MKIQIDTIAKTIKLEEKIGLGDLYHSLEEMFPNDLWRDFTLEVTQITNWVQPWIYRPYEPYPWITYGTCKVNTYEVDTFTLNEGLYNVDTSWGIKIKNKGEI